ncbi:MAG: hypothetical protein HY673_03985 [Chloroflexi bacterium]|nr:hypothetical protein [Chloroflexota bacterium]
MNTDQLRATIAAQRDAAVLARSQACARARQLKEELATQEAIIEQRTGQIHGLDQALAAYDTLADNEKTK